ncbi:MAG: 30S ribosomal protein S8e, partial [Candidatus Pacearchaeota archaeon]
ITKIFKCEFFVVFMARKASGGKYKRVVKKKLTGRAGQSRVVKLDERKTKLVRGRGRTMKLVSLRDNKVNLTMDGKTKKVDIKNVVETPSNIFLARQNVLVKGAIIETEHGKARITNRPSQEGSVQAVLVK